MTALLCINAAAAGSLPVLLRRTSAYNAALTAPVSGCAALARKCAAEKAAATAAIKEAEDVPLSPFEQSLVAVGSLGDEAAVNKLGYKEAFTYVMYGTVAFFAGWIVSAIGSVIESIPLLPRVLEIVGLGYTIWFSSRYLLFKESRDELFAKAYDLRVKIIGS